MWHRFATSYFNLVSLIVMQIQLKSKIDKNLDEKMIFNLIAEA